jgi:hypothetical protein
VREVCGPIKRINPFAWTVLIRLANPGGRERVAAVRMLRKAKGSRAAKAPNEPRERVGN